MENFELWKQLEQLKSNYDWIELTHELRPETPHWIGWDPLEVEEKLNLDDSLFSAHTYKTVGQYGTHVDAPSHMVEGGRSLEAITLKEMAYPLCVIDMTQAVKQNDNYVLTIDDVKSWEKQYGEIPEGAFVAFRSDWSKRKPEDMDNFDKEGNRNFPGWGLETLKFLVEERNVGAIGHEPSDTDSPISSGKTNYEVEYYILAQNRIQIELMKNLDQSPAVGAIILCTFPKVTGASGFPARCFAICPK